MSLKDIAARVPAEENAPVEDADHADADHADAEHQVSEPTADLTADPTPSITDRLMQPLEGSIREDRIGELWNPEDGGLNRVVLAAEESIGLSDGLPRAIHLMLGLAEWYAMNADGISLPGQPDEETSSSADPDPDPDPNTDTAEVLEYGR